MSACRRSEKDPDPEKHRLAPQVPDRPSVERPRFGSRRLVGYRPSFEVKCTVPTQSRRPITIVPRNAQGTVSGLGRSRWWPPPRPAARDRRQSWLQRGRWRWGDTRDRRGPTVDQTRYRLIGDALRGSLYKVVQAGLGAVEGIGSVQYQASAVLYTLLRDHPIDQRGRCRSCRRPGAIVALRRRPCRIYLRASYWMLWQPDEVLLSHLADELETDPVPSPGATSLS